MEGELAELEAAWREAERVAGIADDLLLPPNPSSPSRDPSSPRDAPG